MGIQFPYTGNINQAFAIFHANFQSSPLPEELYRHEDAFKAEIRRAAICLAKVKGDSEDVYWTETLPAELFTVLESFQTDASMAAAVGYLIYQSQRRPDLWAHYAPILQVAAGLPL